VDFAKPRLSRRSAAGLAATSGRMDVKAVILFNKSKNAVGIVMWNSSYSSVHNHLIGLPEAVAVW